MKQLKLIVGPFHAKDDEEEDAEESVEEQEQDSMELQASLWAETR